MVVQVTRWVRAIAGAYARPLVLGAAAGGAVVATLSFPLALWFRLFELVNFFRPEVFGIALLAFAVTFPFADRTHRMLMAAMVMANLLLVVAPAALFTHGHSGGRCATASAEGDSGGLHLLSLNLLDDNPRYEKVIDLMRAERPDVIVLQELSEQWRMPLAALNEEWPYQAGKEVGNRALVVFSRWPLGPAADLVSYRAPRKKTQALVLPLRAPRGPVTLVAIHATSPRDDGLWATRNAMFTELAALLGGGRSRTVALGDWNTARWSPVFQWFMIRTALREAEARLLPPSTRFFAGFGLGTLLGSPVDHVAASDDMEITCFRLGPRVGSDHLPLVAEVRLR